MTNRYEDALNEVTDFSKKIEDGSVYICVSGENYETIRSALKLAQEAEQMRRVLEGTKSLLAINADTIEQLRKERDEFATAIIKIHEDQEGDYDFLKFISHPQYILAKKVAGE